MLIAAATTAGEIERMLEARSEAHHGHLSTDATREASELIGRKVTAWMNDGAEIVELKQAN
jgi:hypothetical protein